MKRTEPRVLHPFLKKPMPLKLTNGFVKSIFLAWLIEG